MSREDDAKLYRKIFPNGEARTLLVGDRQIPFWRCREIKGQGSWHPLPQTETLKALAARQNHAGETT